MELGAQIKKYRGEFNLSQEELAEKIYVTRQTVSNWENNKNYPDIQSLLRLSELFQVSLDQLIKGDIDIMREAINQAEVKKFNFYSTIYSVLLAALIFSIIPVLLWVMEYTVAVFVGEVVLFAVTLGFSFKVERLKKENDIHTYKEIVAFVKGKRLDEIEQQRERGKRPYQVFLLCLGTGLLVVVLALVTALVLRLLRA